MGFYPFNRTPTPDTCTSFTITAKNLSKENKYVKSVTLNGRPIADGKIRHADIVKGGELLFSSNDGCPLVNLVRFDRCKGALLR